MPAGEAKTRLLVSIDDQHVHDLPGVVERLRAVGMEVGRTMAALGAVTGSIEPSRLEALRGVEGVAEVEQARDYELPPPESSTQ